MFLSLIHSLFRKLLKSNSKSIISNSLPLTENLGPLLVFYGLDPLMITMEGLYYFNITFTFFWRCIGFCFTLMEGLSCTIYSIYSSSTPLSPSSSSSSTSPNTVTSSSTSSLTPNNPNTNTIPNQYKSTPYPQTMKLLEPFINHWIVCLVTIFLVYQIALLVYRLWICPLARFPGPRLAAASLWYEFYYDVWLEGQYTFKIRELHKIYGMRPLSFFSYADSSGFRLCWLRRKTTAFIFLLDYFYLRFLFPF